MTGEAWKVKLIRRQGCHPAVPERQASKSVCAVQACEPVPHRNGPVLGCDVIGLDLGLAHPLLLVRFPDGSGFSVEHA